MICVFGNIHLAPEEGDTPTKVNVMVNLIEMAKVLVAVNV